MKELGNKDSRVKDSVVFKFPKHKALIQALC